MKENLILEDRNYISAKRAAEIFAYTSDYVGQLCRAGKLECKMIGRSWFVTKESILKYQSTISDVQTPTITIPEIPTAVAPTPTTPVSPIVTTTPSAVSEYFNTPLTHISKTNYVKIRPTHIKLRKLDEENNDAVEVENKYSNKNLSTKITLATAFSIAALFFILQSFYPNASFFKEISTYSNSVATSISKSIFENLPNYYANIFSTAKETIANKFNGLVVALSTNSSAQDEVTKDSIRNSFSDDVEIKPDATGESGVIIPVFRKTNGDDFLYVLVPVKDKNKN